MAGITACGGAMTLYCFAYAGGPGHVFHDLARALQGRLVVQPVELPGRGKRRAEPCIADWPTATRTLLEAIHPGLDRPYALLGYSFGALAALEVAHAACTLPRGMARRPEALVACALAGPRGIVHRQPLHRMSDIDMFRRLTALGGVPEELLDAPELIALSAPSMRADLTLFETYAPRTVPLEDVPLHVYAGRDDASVGDSHKLWRQETRADVTERLFAGGHMFLHQDVAAVADALAADVRLAA